MGCCHSAPLAKARQHTHASTNCSINQQTFLSLPPPLPMHHPQLVRTLLIDPTLASRLQGSGALASLLAGHAALADAVADNVPLAAALSDPSLCSRLMSMPRLADAVAASPQLGSLLVGNAAFGQVRKKTQTLPDLNLNRVLASTVLRV